MSVNREREWQAHRLQAAAGWGAEGGPLDGAGVPNSEKGGLPVLKGPKRPCLEHLERKEWQRSTDLSEVSETALDLEMAGRVQVQGATADHLEETGKASNAPELQCTYCTCLEQRPEPWTHLLLPLGAPLRVAWSSESLLHARHLRSFGLRTIEQPGLQITP